MTLATIKNLKDDVDFHLIVGERGELVTECENLGVKTQIVKSLKRNVSLFNDMRTILILREYIRVNEIHVVHSHSTKPGILCRVLSLFMSKVKFVHTVHGTAYSRLNVVRGLIYFFEMTLAVFNTRTIVMRKLDLTRIGFFGLNRKVVFLRNPISVAPKVQVTKDINRLVFIGRLEYQKNPLEFIKLYDSLKHRLEGAVVIGDGSLREPMEDYVKSNGLNCEFLGWRSNPWSEVLSGDAVVCTSRYEGMPLVVLEAVSRDIPVVARRIPGVEDIFSDFKPLFLYRNLKEVEFIDLDKKTIVKVHAFNREILNNGLYDVTARTNQLYKGLL